MKSKRLFKRKKAHSKKVYYGGTLREGSLVRIQNIKAKPELNGREGICIKYFPDKDRWDVESKEGDKLGNLSSANLFEIESEPKADIKSKHFDIYLDEVHALLYRFGVSQAQFNRNEINKATFLNEYDKIIRFLTELDTDLSHYSVSPPNENINNIFDVSIDKGMPFLFLFFKKINFNSFNKSQEVIEKVRIIIELLRSKGANINISDPRNNDNIILKEIKVGRQTFIQILLENGANPNQEAMLFSKEDLNTPQNINIKEIPIILILFTLFSPIFLTDNKTAIDTHENLTNIFVILMNFPGTNKNIIFSDTRTIVHHHLYPVQFFFRQQLEIFTAGDVLALCADKSKSSEFKSINPQLTTGYPDLLRLLLENNNDPKLKAILEEIKQAFDRRNPVITYKDITVTDKEKYKNEQGHIKIYNKSRDTIMEIYTTHYASIIDDKLKEIERRRQEILSKMNASKQPTPVIQVNPLSDADVIALQGAVANENIAKGPSNKKKGNKKGLPLPLSKEEAISAIKPSNLLDFNPLKPADFSLRTENDEALEKLQRQVETEAAAGHADWLRKQQEINEINDVYLNKLEEEVREQAPADNLDIDLNIAAIAPEKQGFKSDLKQTAAEFRPRQGLTFNFESDIQNPLAIEFKQLVTSFIQKSKLSKTVSLLLVNDIYIEVEKEIQKYIPYYSISQDFAWYGTYKLELALIILIIGFLSCQFSKSGKCDILLKGGKSLQMTMDIDSTDIDVLLIPVYKSKIKITDLQYFEYATYINNFILWVNADNEYVFPWISEYKTLGETNPTPNQNFESSSIVKISTQLDQTTKKEMIDIGYGYNYLKTIIKSIIFTPLPLLIQNFNRPLNTELNYWYLSVFQIIEEKLFYHYYYTTYSLGEDNKFFLSKIPKFLAYLYKDADINFLKSEIQDKYLEVNQKYIIPNGYKPLPPEKIQELIDAVTQMYNILNKNSQGRLKAGSRWNTKKHKRYKKTQRKSKKGRRKY